MFFRVTVRKGNRKFSKTGKALLKKLSNLLFVEQKLVLAFRFAEFSEYDAVLGANVVAGKAVGAAVAPLRTAVLERDVLCWANVGTPFAGDAGVGGAEQARAGKVFVEERTQHVAFGPGKGSGLCASDVAVGIDVGGYFGKKGKRCADFALFDSIGIDIEARQTDVGVGHNEREGGGELQAYFVELSSDELFGSSNVVATGGYHINIGRWMADEAAQLLLDELLIDGGCMPGVYGEDESDARIVGRSERCVADVLSTVGCEAGNVAGNVAAVASAREVEYHSVRRAFVEERTVGKIRLCRRRSDRGGLSQLFLECEAVAEYAFERIDFVFEDSKYGASASAH